MKYFKIHDPKKPGDYLMLAECDFRAGVHVPFDQPLPAPVVAVPPAGDAVGATPDVEGHTHATEAADEIGTNAVALDDALRTGRVASGRGSASKKGRG